MTPQLPGALTDPLVGLVLVAVAVNALSAYLAYRLARSLGTSVAGSTRAVGREQSTDTRDSETTVECRECGTENEVGYQYCRECVAELPGAVGVERTDPGAADRLVR